MQLCGFPSLDLVQEGQLIGKEEWINWNAERPRELPVGGAQTFPNSASGSDTESTEGNIDSDSEYDLESLIDTDEGSDSFGWENYPLPENIDELKSQLLTPRGMSMTPVNLPNVHVPENYRPATPIYSPTSPHYSPSMSPDPVETDSSETITPTTSSNGIISTRDCDMFDMSNCISDQELEGEAETISLVGDFKQGQIAC